MIFSKNTIEMPFEKAVPFNEDSLLFMTSYDTGLLLYNISNEKKETLAIKEIMTRNRVFNCRNFDKVYKEIPEILDTRLERFFITNKTSYIFFDKEEQVFLKETFDKYEFYGLVDIYMRNEIGEFKKIIFEEINLKTFNLIKKDLSDFKVVYCMKPERYFLMKQQFEREEREEEENKFKFSHSHSQKKDKLEVVIKRYDLSKIKTKEEVKKIYRQLARSCHPDLNKKGDKDQFIKLKEDFDFINNSMWYKKLS